MEIKRETSFTKNTKCSDAYTESHADYILPDYLGDVRKILFTEATLRPSGRFAGGDEVEFSGVVVYNVIYLDGENNLSSLEFTSDYDYSVKCSGDSYKDSISDTRVSNYAIRLIGPRKISARASLVGSVHLSESDVLAVSGDAFDADAAPEVNTKSVNIRVSTLSQVSEREYAEQLARLEGMVADEVSVVISRGEATVDSVEREEDSVNVKGKLRLTAVISTEESPAYSVEKQISFDESIDFEGLRDDMRLLPQLTVSSMKTVVNADESGCSVVASAILECCVVAESNESVDLVLDSYLKNCATENSYDDFTYQSLSEVSGTKGLHNAELERSEIESEGLNEIIFLTATPKIERTEQENGRVNIIGEVRYSGIASEMVDGKVSYVSLKFTSPFAVNVNNNCQNDEKTRIEAKVLASSASASLDSSRLYASCNLESVVTICQEKSERILISSVKGMEESKEGEGSTITVYYPTEGDTLFSVAKKFRTSSLKVARDNDISESVFAADNPDGSLSGIKKLLIY